MLNICISGLGRTGSQIAKYLINQNKMNLVSAICSPNSWKNGRDLGEIIGGTNTYTSVYSSDNLESCILNTNPDVVLDFSKPHAAIKNAEYFSKMNVKIVMGTTGFTKAEERKLFSIVSKNKNGMIFAPNITLGVNAMMFLSELASKLLANYDMEIIELHHKRKLDFPSGTALKIANGMKRSRNVITNFTGPDIPISSVRAGGIIGCHKVMLVGENDMIEISHQSFSRDAFAEGSLYAAEFIKDKIGVFEMKDALNYESIITDYLTYNSKPLESEKISFIQTSN